MVCLMIGGGSTLKNELKNLGDFTVGFHSHDRTCTFTSHTQIKSVLTLKPGAALKACLVYTVCGKRIEVNYGVLNSLPVKGFIHLIPR